MTEPIPGISEDPTLPEVSGSSDLASVLLQAKALDAPPRPGMLATLDRFEILAVLGQGGMGIVLLARDPVTNVHVAIKMLRPELTREPQAVRRFLTEARHMHRLDHARILRVLEVSDRLSGPYYVMPIQPFGSLGGHIRPGEPLEAKLALGIARDVAEALAHAHAQGVMHRDVKPLNVLLDPDYRAYLADFGLVRALDCNESVVNPGQEGRLGTVAYMSPAVARGEAEDTRCDIYSFGALLYEMLTSHPPYSGASREAIFAQILAGPPMPIRTRNPNALPALAAIAEGCMARELRDRYASMSDVLADLRRVETGQSPLGPRGQAHPSRKRWFYAIGMLAAGVLLVAVTIHRYWQSWPKAGTQAEAIQPVVPVSASVSTEIARRGLLSAWPVVFEDPLTSSSCLARAHLGYATGMGPWNPAFTVSPGEGLRIGGTSHSVAWWDCLVGENYAVSFEFRPFSGRERRDDLAGIGVWLNGPGYGTSGYLGCRFWLSRDQAEYALLGQGRMLPQASGRLDRLLDPEQWYRLEVVRRGEEFTVWLDGVLLLDRSLPAPAEAPLHSYIGIGAASGWVSNRAFDPCFRTLSIRMPQVDAERLAKLPLERQFDGRTDRQPAPGGPILFSDFFKGDCPARWQVRDQPEWVTFGSIGLELSGESGCPLVWRRQSLPPDCAVELNVEFPAAMGTGCLYLFLATEDPQGVRNDKYHGWFLGVPEMGGRSIIGWLSTQTDATDLPWHHYSRPRGIRTQEPDFAPVPGRTALIRLESRGRHLRVFANGRFLMEAEAPSGADVRGGFYLGIGKAFGPKTIRSVQAWKLDAAPASSQPVGPDIEPPPKQPPAAQVSSGDSELQKLLIDWPVAFQDELTESACLERAQLSYPLTHEKHQPAFRVIPDKGLQIGWGVTSVAWFNCLVGDKYAVSVEFLPFVSSDGAKDTGTGLWLNGPGYGISPRLGCRFWLSADGRSFALTDRGIVVPHTAGRLERPLNPEVWHRLELVRDGERFAAWLDGTALFDRRTAAGVESPLNSYIGLGSGSGWYQGPAWFEERARDPVFRSLSIRMPEAEVARLAGLNPDRQLDGQTEPRPRTNGASLLSHEFATDALNGWIVSVDAANARPEPEGLLLAGWSEPLLWLEKPVSGDCAVEFDVSFTTDNTPACLYLLLATADPREAQQFRYDGWRVAVPDHLGENVIMWYSAQAGAPSPYWMDLKKPRTILASEPRFAPPPGRDVVYRLERTGHRLRVFANERFLMEADAPTGAGQANGVYVGFGKLFSPKRVRSVRAWQLNQDSGSTQPARMDADQATESRRPSE